MERLHPGERSRSPIGREWAIFGDPVVVATEQLESQHQPNLILKPPPGSTLVDIPSRGRPTVTTRRDRIGAGLEQMIHHQSGLPRSDQWKRQFQHQACHASESSGT
jgi:hypothetical protein